MWALYALSGVLYLLAYYVARHRHEVIREQLPKVFPKLSEAERNVIHKRFLKNFCDVLVELVKSVSIDAGRNARARAHRQSAVAAHVTWMPGGRSCS